MTLLCLHRHGSDGGRQAGLLRLRCGGFFKESDRGDSNRSLAFIRTWFGLRRKRAGDLNKRASLRIDHVLLICKTERIKTLVIGFECHGTGERFRSLRFFER